MKYQRKWDLLFNSDRKYQKGEKIVAEATKRKTFCSSDAMQGCEQEKRLADAKGSRQIVFWILETLCTLSRRKSESRQRATRDSKDDPVETPARGWPNG